MKSDNRKLDLKVRILWLETDNFYTEIIFVLVYHSQCTLFYQINVF
jgi:hypothetical protein